MTDNDKLPPKARAKIFALFDQQQQLATLMHSTQRQIADLNHSTNTAPASEHVAINKEVERLQTLREKHTERHRAFADLNAKVRRFLDLLPAHVTLDDAKPIKTKAGRRRDPLKVVARMRGEIIALIGERSRVERSSPTIEEIKALGCAVRSVARRTRHASPYHRARQVRHAVRSRRHRRKGPDAVASARVDRSDLVLNRLEAMIDARDKPANPMTAADRKKRLNEIKDELFELERIEQAHIEAAMAEGTLIEQRPNVDIRALLGLVVSREKASAA